MNIKHKTILIACCLLTALNVGAQVIATMDTNAELIRIARRQLWIGSAATEMTKADAEKVTDVKSAFADNTSLTSFDEFQYFTKITVLEKKNANKGLFEGCTNLKSITLPPKVTKIDGFAFSKCSSLTTVVLSETLREIGDNAFFECSSLTMITLPSAINKIGTSAFSGCKKLTSITAKMTTPPTIDESVFYYGVYTNATLTVPAGRKSTYQSTTAWNKFLTIKEESSEAIATISTNPELIKIARAKGWISSSATQMTKTDAEKVTDISGAFTKNTDLKSFDEFQYFTKVTTLSKSEEGGTFQNCTALQSIKLPSSITEIGDNAFWRCSSLKEIIIPQAVTTLGSCCLIGCSSLTTITIPQKVATIKYGAFASCTNLKEIKVNSSNKNFTSVNGVLFSYDKKTLYSYPAGKESAYSIPSGTTGLYKWSFYGCSKLTSVTIPSTVNTIETFCFSASTSLTDITVQMTTPSQIPESAFDDKTYETATLTVPSGCKSLYKSTPYWSSFNNIVEAGGGGGGSTTTDYTLDNITYTLTSADKKATIKTISANRTDLVIPSTVKYNNTTYNVTAVGSKVFNNGVSDYNLYSASFPSSITEVASDAFATFGTATIIWNSNVKLPASAFSGTNYTNQNFLLYVNGTGIAPSGVQNVVVNGTAEEIVLRDDASFNCPKAFTARKISFTHNYKMETVIGESAGWETLALPFDVKTVTHATKGELVPFANYTSGSDKKPFWLYSLSSSGFVKASSIKANTPYIISMPNNSRYQAAYNVAGKVTFSATNATVNQTNEQNWKTATFNGGTFYPCFSFYSKSSTTYAMNVTNDYYTYSGTERPGSIFKANYRRVNPFEARISMSSGNSPVFTLDFSEEGTTDIDLLDVDIYNSTGVVRIYSLSGQLLQTTTRTGVETLIRQLPSGVYIVDGKKVIIR